MLQRFTEKLLNSSRPYDFVGRDGDEEFVICLPGADISQSESVAERMRSKVEEMKIVLPDDSQYIRITASFGATSFLMDSKGKVDSLIKRADNALYKAKNVGRNRVCMESRE